MFKSKLWRNKYFHYFLIFSLLLHAILYFFFFSVGFRTHSVAMMRKLMDGLTLSHTERLNRIQQHEQLIKKLQEFRKPHDNGLPAKLKPRKSDFGWVFFNDEPASTTATKTQVPTTEKGEVAQAPTPHATELVPEKPPIPTPTTTVTPIAQPVDAPQSPVVTHPTTPQHSKPQQPPDIKKIEKEQPLFQQPQQIFKQPRIKSTIKSQRLHKTQTLHAKKQQQPKLRTEKQLKKDLKSSHNETIVISSLLDELRHEPDNFVQEPTTEQRLEDQEYAQAWEGPEKVPQPSPDTQARIERIAHMQDQVAHYAPTPSAPAAGGHYGAGTGKVATAKVRGARAIMHRSKRNIIALTKGFVENLKDEGEDDIERDGDPNKRPSFEEMKYISYESNINWCLQAAWKQNFAYNPTIQVHEGKAVIEFTLNEKGYVTKSELLQSTGYRDLDAVIMKNLQFANPFPPLPKHFGVKNYTTGRIIHVFCNRFGM